MSDRQTQQSKSAGISVPHRDSSGLLQRKCTTCGQHTIAGGTCGSCEKRKGVLQRKLMIGASNDPLEVEADRVADQVMAEPSTTAVNASCTKGDDALDKLARKEAGAALAYSPVPPIVHDVLRQPGVPLNASTRAFFEPRFGHDFSRLRIHADARAVEAARTI